MGTATVTGASSGIGLELARLVAADGHEVILARSEQRLAALAGDLPGARPLTLGTTAGREA